MRTPALRHTPWLALLLSISACGDKTGDTGDTGTSGPPPSWETVRDDVLVPSCGFASCHAPPGSASFGIDSESSADEFIEVPAFQDESYFLVDPGSPDSSYLLMKLEDAAGIQGDPMPPGTALDADRVQLVRDWISGLE